MRSSAPTSRAAWIALALALFTFALYAPALRCQFLTYDDQAYVTQNQHVLRGLSAASVPWAFRSVTAGNWQPVTLLSHIFDCQIYGLRPWGHHLTNILLHTANTVLVFLVLLRMTGAQWRSACVAALFAAHPTRVESVAWVAERKDVLCGFFVLLSVWAYARYAEAAIGPKRRGLYGLVLALFALALMSKPMAVTLPCALLLLDYWPLRRFNKATWLALALEKLPLLALSAAACAVTLWTQRRGHALPSLQTLPLIARLEHATVAYLQYLRLLVFPWHLAVFYPYRLHEPAWEIVAGILPLIAVTAWAVAARTRHPYFLTGWLWFLGMLFPVIGLVQAGGQGWADRYTYLPAIGVFIAVVWGVAEWARRMEWLPVGAIAAVAACAVLTLSELRYWRDTRTLFSRAMEVTEGNYLAMTLVGSMKADAGDLAGAKALYQEALRYQRDYPEAHLFLGRALEREGKTEEAIGEYRRAAALKPELAEASVLEGLLLAKEGKLEEAAGCYEAALRSDPESAAAENDWGRVLQTEGRLPESVMHYKRALALDNSLAQAHNNLGIEYLQSGKLAAGIPELQAALKLEPGNHETEYNLAEALNQAERWSEAAALLKPLAASQPDNARVQYQYGLALQHTGDIREAMGCFAAAILRDPNFAEPLNELAWIAATSPRAELRNGAQAVQLAQRACALTARQRPEMLLTLAAAEAETGDFGDAKAAIAEAEGAARARQDLKTAALGEQVRAAISAGHAYRQ